MNFLYWGPSIPSSNVSLIYNMTLDIYPAKPQIYISEKDKTYMYSTVIPWLLYL